MPCCKSIDSCRLFVERIVGSQSHCFLATLRTDILLNKLQIYTNFYLVKTKIFKHEIIEVERNINSLILSLVPS